MNESYAETYVKKKEDTKTLIIKILLGLGVLLGIFFLISGSFFSILGVIIIAGIVFLFPRLDIEYEYIFVDGQLDFDKIMGKSKRKHMLRVNFDQVEIMAPSDSNTFKNNNHKGYITKDYSSGDKETKTYTLLYTKEQDKLKVIFEPSEKMIDCIKQKHYRKIVTY